MRYEQLLHKSDKNHWYELEVTIGTNESLIEDQIQRLQRFLNKFDDTEIEALEGYTDIPLSQLRAINPDGDEKIVKLLLVKTFLNQQDLNIVAEARNSPGISEKGAFLEICRELFGSNKFPDDIFVYSTYRTRGTPTTWLKIIDGDTGVDSEQKILRKLEGLRRYANKHLKTKRKVRFQINIGDLTLILFAKPITAKVIRSEDKNVEAQRTTFTILVFNRSEKKIGIVSGSKKEVGLMQSYLRRHVFEDSIATPRSDFEQDKKELLVKLLASNPSKNILLKSVSFSRTLMSAQPSMRLKVEGENSLDQALAQIETFWKDLGIDSLKSLEFQCAGKQGVAYLYGDEWKRMCINVAAKRHSLEFENLVLQDLNERLGLNLKESRLLIEPLTDEYILEKILNDKVVSTFPPVPEQVEKIVVELVKSKIFQKPSKISKRKCQCCYSTSWEQWACPRCGREEMIVVGEAINIVVKESALVKKIAEVLAGRLSDVQIIHIPYKQRRSYQKSVIKLYDMAKKMSVFLFTISGKKDIAFAKDLLNEGFGVIAIVDPEISGKIDEIHGMGCSIVPMHKLLEKVKNGGTELLLKPEIEIQQSKILERVFENLREALTRLNNKPATYNEDLFEIDITNVLQAVVPDVTRLGTEFKGKKVPDGYCCYGYRESRLRKRKRLFGWDAKFSYSASYKLGASDLKKQKGYIEWLTNKKNAPFNMGDLGIYAFISNFDKAKGFDRVLKNLANLRDIPKQCRVVLIEDKFLVKIGEWLQSNWKKVLENNSVSAEILFQFLRRKTPNKPYGIFGLSRWGTLEKKLNDSL